MLIFKLLTEITLLSIAGKRGKTASVETAIENINNDSVEEKHQIRQQLVGAVKSAQKCNNLNYLERNVIRSLKKDENIIMLRQIKVTLL